MVSLKERKDFLKKLFKMTGTHVVYNHPAYVRFLCIIHNVYANGLSIEQGADTAENFQKKKKKLDRELKSRNKVSTCKVNRDPKILIIIQQTRIKSKQISPKNTLERLPSGVTNSAMGKIPLICV
jgi:hypothetical protein